MKLKTALLICLSFVFHGTAIANNEKFYIGYPDHIEYEPKVVSTLLQEVYAELGKNLELITMPSKRIEQQMNYQKIDGDIARFEKIESNLNYLRINVPLSIVKLQIAYNKNLHPKFDLQSLNKYRSGLLRGAVASKVLIGDSTQFTEVSTKEQLVQLLKNSRVDYIIGAFDAKQIGTEYKIQDIASFPLYHYINAKHSSIKKSLEEKLKKKITKALAKKLNEEAYLLLNIKLR